MSVKITGRQWAQFIDYIESDAYADDAWIDFYAIDGTVNGERPKNYAGWAPDLMEPSSCIEISGGEIVEGQDEKKLFKADLVTELRKYFCKL